MAAMSVFTHRPWTVCENSRLWRHGCATPAGNPSVNLHVRYLRTPPPHGTPVAVASVVNLARPHDSDTRVEVALSERSDACATLAVPRAGIALDALERALLAFALDFCRGNRSRAAAFLSLSRSALIYRVHKYGLTAAPPLLARHTGRFE